jgi:phosphodiesterase/alkaline phosphatase D-like protein
MKARILFIVGIAGGLLGLSLPAQAQSPWNSVTLTWTTPGDDSLIGNATQFDLRYSTSPITAANFASATQFTGMPTPGTPGTVQNVTVTGLNPGTLYYFNIKTADDAGNWSLISNTASKTTAAAPDVVRPYAISNVSVTSVTDTTANLSWTATGDDSLTGTATRYDIRYSTSPITAGNFASATAAASPPTPTAAGTTQTFTVRGLSRQRAYYFAMKAIDDASNASDISNVANASTTDTMAPGRITTLVAGFFWFAWHTGSGHAVKPEAGR